MLITKLLLGAKIQQKKLVKWRRSFKTKLIEQILLIHRLYAIYVSLVSPGGEIYSGCSFFHIKLNCICINSVHFIMLLELGKEAVARLLDIVKQHVKKAE